MLGILHSMTGNADAAEASCRRVIALQPNSHTAYNNLGTILKNKGQPSAAIACYRKALEIAPGYANAANNLATLLRETGDRDEALAHYRNAVRLQPDYAEAYSNLGALLQDMGDLAGALQAYQQAVRLQPDSALWLFNLGCGLREAGKFEDSARAFQQSLQRDQNSARTWDGLCHVQLELRRFEDACQSGLRALQLEPDLVEACLHTAAAHQASGRTAAAIELYRRALEIDPGNETARYFLAVMGVMETPDRSPADYVRKLFDGYAETFDEALVNKLEYRTPALLFDLARQHFQPDRDKLDIIDLGCGTGLCGTLFRPLAKQLVGVDLAPKMIQKARERAVYDTLLVDDLTPPLLASPAAYDLVLAADVFVYIGDLWPVFAATTAALRPGGHFLFSTEKAEAGQAIVLRDSGRYAHSKDYISELAARAGFEMISSDDVFLRKDGGKDIRGMLYNLRRPAAGS